MDSLKITVTEMCGVDCPRPVTGGVPLPEGAAPRGSRFELHDAGGEGLLLQNTVLATWRDGSARWVLLDFVAAIPARATAAFLLTWCGDAARVPDVSPSEADAIGWTGAEGGVLEIDGRLRLELQLTDGEGRLCRAAGEQVTTETSGPVRATRCVKGAFYAPGGDRLFQFRLRASAYSGLRRFRLEPLVLIDPAGGVIRNIRSLDLVISPVEAAERMCIGGAPGWQGGADSTVRLFQVDDETYRFEGADAVGGKAPGWAEVADARGTVAVALRDFWQQWPKSLEVDSGRLVVGLLPAFEAGTFGHMGPWYKHQYLFEADHYRLRTGQARKWDLWVDLNGNGEALAATANAPLVPAADPEQAIGTGVWHAVTPAGTPEKREFDPWLEDLFDAYCASIRIQRDYGAMNWGDWFGERKVNWGNHEYDTLNQLLIQFARTGDPKYFLAADATARHSTEVDVVHFVNDDLAAHFTDNWGRKGYPPRAGMVHEHCIGHVGSFYPTETIRKLFVEHGVGNSDRPYLCLDPFNLGHIWTQGMVRHYFLTGDPFIKETVDTIGDNLARLVEDGVQDFGITDPHFGRAAGWPLLALAGAYEMDFDDRFLKAMTDLVDRALDRQDPHCGGWLYSLYPGHCHCETRHVGMAGFITSVLINGLSRFYELSGDERVPGAVDRALTFLDNDTWDDHRRGWRYTSCPASPFTGQAGVTIMAHVNGVRLTDNPEHRRILKRAWDAKFERFLADPPAPGPGQGKSYTSTVYGCAEAVGALRPARGVADSGE